MDEMTTMLQRIRTLSVQAANGTNTTSDRASIQSEVTALSQEITRIACRTSFGGKKVLSAYGTSESIITSASIQGTGANAKVTGKINFQVGSNHDDLQTLDMNLYKDDKSAVRDNNVNNKGGYCLENLMKVAGMAGGNDTTKCASFMVNADGTTVTSGTGDYTVFDVRTSKAAQATLASIDKVINLIDTKRGDFGALENRMSSTISNQTNIMNNAFDLSTCQSRRPTARTPRQTALRSRPRSRRCLRKSPASPA
ncbi:MAG: hypothetical protein SPL30_04055, partial [Succinivibrio sp.]|nr:hypothetical protein [Succinivibrio sp.]